jgi:hypothetical protein
LPSNANWSTRIPGNRNWSRSVLTSGVITPRSSAMNGRAPNSFSAVRKKSAPGPGPLAGLGRRCSDWHVPGGCERSEMIEANHVHMTQQRT